MPTHNDDIKKAFAAAFRGNYAAAERHGAVPAHLGGDHASTPLNATGEDLLAAGAQAHAARTAERNADPRVQAALVAGIDPAWAERLHGDTAEELLADASRIKALVDPPQPKPAATPKSIDRSSHEGLKPTTSGAARSDDPLLDALKNKLSIGE